MHEIDNTSIDAEANMRKKLGKKPPGVFRNRNVNVSETEVYTCPLTLKAAAVRPRRFSRGFTDDRFNTRHSYLEHLQMGLPGSSKKVAGTLSELGYGQPNKKKFGKNMQFRALIKQKSVEYYRKGVHSFSHQSDNISKDEKVHSGEVFPRSNEELEVRPSHVQDPPMEDLVQRKSTGKKSSKIRSKSNQSESTVNKYHVKGRPEPDVKNKSLPKIRKVRNWTSPKPLRDLDIAIDRNPRPETEAGASRRATRAKPSKKLGFFSIKGDKVKPITKQVVKDIIVSRPSQIRRVPKHVGFKEQYIEKQEKGRVSRGSWKVILPERMLVQKGSQRSSRRGSSRCGSIIPPEKEVGETTDLQKLFESMIRGIKNKRVGLDSPTNPTRKGIRDSLDIHNGLAQIKPTMENVEILIHPASDS